MSRYPITFNERWDMPRDDVGGQGLRLDVERLLAEPWTLTLDDRIALATDAALGRRDVDDMTGAAQGFARAA
jgi:hypothetical protein